MQCIELLNPLYQTMGIRKIFVLLLFISIATDVWSHHHHGHYSEHRRKDNRVNVVEETSNFGKITDIVRSELSKKDEKYPETADSKVPVPSARKLEKMLEKAILQIIIGDLSKADMLLLKSLNYSLEEVLMIRERELGKRENEESRKRGEPKFFDERKSHDGELYGKREKHRNRNSMELDSSSRDISDIQESRNTKRKNRYKEKTSHEKNFDFEAHNRQAAVDYENLSSMLEAQPSRPKVFDSSSREISESQELKNTKKNRYKKKSSSSYEKDLDLEAYNRQATIDYENFASKFESQLSAEFVNSNYEDETRKFEEQDSSRNFDRSSDRAVKPQVVFKIRYDDSEFDSNPDSKEKSSPEFIDRDDVTTKNLKQSTPSTLKDIVAKNVGNFVHSPQLFSSSSSSSSSSASTTITAATAPLLSSTSSSIVAHTPLPPVYQLGAFKTPRTDYSSTTKSPEFNSTLITNITSISSSGVLADLSNSTNDNSFNKNKNEQHSEYEGLIWIADDVYRAKGENPLNYENIEEDQSDYEDENLSTLLGKNDNDTYEYQNETPDPPKPSIDSVNGSIENASMTNLSAYQQLILEHRREENVTSSFDSQSQRMIEDIKSRILALTGRFNFSTNTNQVQREKLAMFSPTCQIPRNTDSEAWADPFSMNMHFQLNLTSDDHIVAARLRIYRLPQENLTTTTSEIFDEDEDDEKKIRISVYYYTKALKKHRAKKRLMDSVVTPLTPDGMHLALNVRHGLKFWRLSSRNPHGSNHGLAIQIEDQDGRPLKPALYIQQPSCVDPEPDSKAYQHIPALFIRACARYIRIVNGEKVTYVDCRH